jgi:hypothetical protein
MNTTTRIAVALCFGLATAGCSDSERKPLDIHRNVPLDVLPDSFEQLYPVFLMHKLPRGQKAKIWADHYRGRWIKWTGRVVSFGLNSVMIKQINQTVTFDVTLQVPDPERREQIKRTLKPGQHVAYLGKLASYDDVFRTFYLQSGVVLLETATGFGPLPNIPDEGTTPLIPGSAIDRETALPSKRDMQ